MFVLFVLIVVVVVVVVVAAVAVVVVATPNIKAAGGGVGGGGAPPILLRFKVAVFVHFSPQTISCGFFSCFFWCGVRSSFPNLRTRLPPRRHASLSSKRSRGAQPPCAVRDFDNSDIIPSIITIIMIILINNCLYYL